MTLFLSGADLTNAITKVLAGNKVRCAVAFWGAGSDALLNHFSGEKPRIICDVNMGSTSPAALRALGAPENDRLRHIPNLHAKVYISDEGAVVGSANASDNGVGIDGPAHLIESGVFLAPGDRAFNEAVSWFEAQLKVSRQVDESALELATKRFKPRRTLGSRAVRPGSLFDLIATDPDGFSDISIVLTKTAATQSERDQARADLKVARPQEAKYIDNLRDKDMFIDWEIDELNRWHRAFIEFWMPAERLYVYGRKVVYFDDVHGNVLSRKSWPSVRSAVDRVLPTAPQIAGADEKMARQLLDMHGNRLFSASDLAQEIDKLSGRKPA